MAGVGVRALDGALAPAFFGGDGWLSKYACDAALQTGLNDETLRMPWQSEFIDNTEYAVSANASSTQSSNVQGPPGILEVNNGAGTTQQGAIVSPPQFNASQFVASLATKRWYAVSAFKIPTLTPDTHSRFCWFSVGAVLSYFCAVGFNATGTNATKFGFSNSATDGGSPLMPKFDTAISTIAPIVGQWATIRMWNDLNNIWFSVNGETAIVGVATASVNVGPVTTIYHQSQPSANGQADKLQMDKAAFWSEA